MEGTGIQFRSDFKDLDAAKRAATDAQADISGLTFPIMLFRQGARRFISTVMPVIYIAQYLKSNPTEKEKGISDVLNATNRPLNQEHANGAKEYLKKNYKGNYILPPLTLNVHEDVLVYTPNLISAITPGYMVVPYQVSFTVTDGQHRKRALEDLIKELPPEDFQIFKNDGIPVMITVENDIHQIHQDFADCSKSKELPKSLIAIYDVRNPANGFVQDLITNCRLFTDKVDATSNSLSKNSNKLFLVSQVRSYIKEFITGSSATADTELERIAYAKYESSNSPLYKKHSAEFIQFTNEVTSSIDILNQVAHLDKKGMARLPELRAQYLILNSAGLNIIGRIGKSILQDEEKRKDMSKYIGRLANIDWRKGNALWLGNIVQQGAKGLKISTANSTIKEAVRIVKEEIGLIEKQNTLM